MRTRVVVGVLAAVVAVAACGRRGGCTGEYCGTLVIAAPGEPDILLPPASDDARAAAVFDQVFVKLADLGPSGNTIGDAGFVPELAEKWEWDNPRTLTFRLNAAARWHDGRRVRAEDVAFTFDVNPDPAVNSPARASLARVRRVTTRDSLTVVFHFSEASPEMFYDAVHHLRILPAHLLRTVPRDQLRTAPFGRAPVGAGCYRFVAWRAGQSLELAADSTCFLGRPHIRRLLWRFTPDPTVAVTQLVAGEADVYEYVPPQDLQRVRADSQLVTYPYAGPYYTFLGFNLRARGDTSLPHPLFGDRQLRRALTLATDRQQLVQSVFGGLAKVPPGPMPLLWSTWDSTLRVMPFDSAAAVRILAANGWRDHDGDGVRDREGQKLAFELLTVTTSPSRRQYARLLQEQFRRIGVAVEITELESSVMTQRMETGNYDAALVSRIGDPSPTSSIALNWLAGSSSNYTRYDNPVFAEAYARATGATTRDAALRAWRSAFQVLLDDAPAIWLYSQQVVAVVNRRVARSEEHTSELQSPCNLVCRLLLEKKKKKEDSIRRVYIMSESHIQS